MSQSENKFPRQSPSLSAKAMKGSVLSTLGLTLGPMLAVVVVAWVCLTAVENKIKADLRENMQMALARSIKTLKIWESDAGSKAESLAQDAALQKLYPELSGKASGGGVGGQVLVEKSWKELAKSLNPKVDQYGFSGFVILDKSGYAIAASSEDAIGHSKLLSKAGAEFFELALMGNTTLALPFKSEVPIPDQNDVLQKELPTMLIATPLSGQDGEPFAVLALRLRPEEVFTHIFEIQQSGDTGELYAFNSRGYLISSSRFNSQLQNVGLLDQESNGISILNIELLDPGINLIEEGTDSWNGVAASKTRMAQSALQGETGYDFLGYRDYRGVPVVGTWSWLPEFGFGVANEMDVEEAYDLIYFLRRWFFFLFGFLFLTSSLAMISRIRQKNSQREMLVAKEMAEKANRHKSEFLARMSHEFRTPLGVMLGFTQLLELDQKNPLKDEQREHLTRVTQAGRHLLDMVNEILDLSKIESGRLDLVMEPFDIVPVIDSVILLSKPLADQRNIEINFRSDFENSVTVELDQLRFKQVVINLISNAIKYNVPDGKVSLFLSNELEGRVRLSVQDTGKGIPEDNHDKLFKPFERFDPESESIEGTGIGLTICKRLVEAMNGVIGFQSKPGKGSEFYIDFPLSKQPANVHENVDPKSAEWVDESVSGEKILYIDDTHANLKLVENILSGQSNIEFLASSNAMEGIQMIQSELPNLVLMDIQMPGMDGLQAFRELQSHEKTKHIPVIALTANAMDGSLKEAMEMGFADYITKPIDVQEFTKTVKRVMSESRSLPTPD